MTLLRRSLGAVVAIVSATLLPASANEFSDYGLASKQFAELVEGTADQHTMPRQSDPKAAALLLTLGDHQRFLNARPFKVDELRDVLGMCGGATKIVLSYLSFDAEKDAVTSEETPEQASERMMRLAGRNAIDFQDELTPLLAFQHRCLAKQMPLVTAFGLALKPAEFTQVRRDGLIRARNGLFISFIGFINSTRDQEISLAHRRTVFAVMAEIAPSYSQALDLGSRKKVYDYLDSVGSTVPAEFADLFKQLKKELSSVKCEGLCSL